ncbi:hypothetical_protein [Candidozyma auris]|uniref:hypothetical_protein n=1 Tax=Candidozyma auris TaxID=498019 RepID=UPI000D27822C|nr:hypothetical_protein [[Candida] auris]QEO20500.1 hypothetical_protein [[Candida] auris]GBL49527.1 hypothetical protein CAJCM15448_18010 [[Candida] auris]
MSKRSGDSLESKKLVTYKRKKKRNIPYIHNSLTSKPDKRASDDEDTLIDIRLASPNKHTPSRSKPNFEDLDKLIDKERSKSGSPRPVETTYSSLPTSILEGNLDLEQPTLDRYKKRKFPLPTSRRALKARVEKLLPTIPKLLAGEEELSFYYTLALDQRKKSPHKTMTSSEQDKIEWKRFIGGFYGLKRQHFVARLILTTFGDELRKSPNKTIVYWTPESFATYVLANEILLRILAADEGLSFAEAERFMKDTIDYGCYAADGVEFKDDIELGDVLGMSEKTEEKDKKEKTEKKEKKEEKENSEKNGWEKQKKK